MICIQLSNILTGKQNPHKVLSSLYIVCEHVHAGFKISSQASKLFTIILYTCTFKTSIILTITYKQTMSLYCVLCPNLIPHKQVKSSQLFIVYTLHVHVHVRTFPKFPYKQVKPSPLYYRTHLHTCIRFLTSNK